MGRPIKKEAGGGNFCHQDLAPRGLFKAVLSQVQNPWVQYSWFHCRTTPCPRSGDHGLGRGQQEVQVQPRECSLSGTSPQAPSEPGHCIGTQAYSGSGDVTSTLVTIPEGNGVSISFPLFFKIYFFLICLFLIEE